MVQFQPFAGWRYDMSQVGSLGDVICSVPEEILLSDNSDQLIDDLYRQHPCNAVRLVLNRGEPGDQAASDRIARMVDFFELWKREEILFQEHDAAFYVIEQTSISHPEIPACVSVVGRISCDELQDAAGRSAAEITSMTALQEVILTARTQFAPVQAVVTEHETDVATGELFQSLIPRLHGMTPVEIYEESGRRLRVWVVTDRKVVEEIRQRAASAQIAIVAGFETLAGVIRAHRNGSEDQKRFAMVWLTDADDPGLTLLPSAGVLACQVLRGEGDATSFERLAEKLGSACRVELVGNESFAPADALELAEIHEHQPACCIGIKGQQDKSGQWALISFRNQVPRDTPGFTIESAQADLVRHIAEALTEAAGSSVRLQPLVCDRQTPEQDAVASRLSGMLATAPNDSIVVAVPDSLRVNRHHRGGSHPEGNSERPEMQRQRATIPAGKAGVVYYSVDE